MYRAPVIAMVLLLGTTTVVLADESRPIQIVLHNEYCAFDARLKACREEGKKGCVQIRAECNDSVMKLLDWPEAYVWVAHVDGFFTEREMFVYIGVDNVQQIDFWVYGDRVEWTATRWDRTAQSGLKYFPGIEGDDEPDDTDTGPGSGSTKINCSPRTTTPFWFPVIFLTVATLHRRGCIPFLRRRRAMP